MQIRSSDLSGLFLAENYFENGNTFHQFLEATSSFMILRLFINTSISALGFSRLVEKIPEKLINYCYEH